MTISVDVKLRYADQILKGLTTFDARGATAIDDTVLDAAIADIAGEFLSRGALELDDTDPEHVNVACHGVIALLRHRNASGSGNKAELDAWRDDLDRLATSSSRKRVTPETRSTRETTADDEPIAPRFDEKRFSLSRPASPPGSDRLT